VQAVQGRKRRKLLTLLEARIAGRGEATSINLIDTLCPEEAEPKAAASLK
jgi:hypothetical protein